MEASFSSGLETEEKITGIHPAIHPRPEKSIRIDGPLFDRQGRPVRRSIEFDSRSSLERAMRMHPAGKGLPKSVDSTARGSQGEQDNSSPNPRPPRVPTDRGETGRLSSTESLGTDSSPSHESATRRRTRRTGETSESCAGAPHRVRSGETLWSIAADALGTADLRRIARYWPKIHRHNRDVIGSNPDRIFPGQLLQLPTECDD